MAIMKARIGGTSILSNLLQVLGISILVTIIGYTVGQIMGGIF
jgi:VIT1/CCC1 family predicted Fe2+/Mn2+ transporter